MVEIALLEHHALAAESPQECELTGVYEVESQGNGVCWFDWCVGFPLPLLILSSHRRFNALTTLLRL